MPQTYFIRGHLWLKISRPRNSRSRHVALVEVHIFLGQIGGIHHRVRLAEIQVDVQFKFLRRDGGAKLLERRLRRLPAFQAPENFLRATGAQ